jgi:thiol-disulfide isomerase/thioredoxin
MKKKHMLGIAIILIVAAIASLMPQNVIPPSMEKQPSVSAPASGVEAPADMDESPGTVELTGITGYLNTEEKITLAQNRGKVILIDFWTYTCINCIRTLPHVIEWDKKYRDKGLVVIGVHTPEFEFEKKTENVENAIQKHGIEYVVVQDNNYATWRAFQNRYWPRKYLIDKQGRIRYDHIGEGGYKETEHKIIELLAEPYAEKQI